MKRTIFALAGLILMAVGCNKQPVAIKPQIPSVLGSSIEAPVSIPVSKTETKIIAPKVIQVSSSIPDKPTIQAVDLIVPKTEAEQDSQIDQNTITNIQQDGKIAQHDTAITNLQSAINNLQTPPPTPPVTPPVVPPPPVIPLAPTPIIVNNPSSQILGISGFSYSPNAVGDNILTQTGSQLTDGIQTIYVKTQDRDNWVSYTDGNVQVRVSNGPWGAGNNTFAGISFKKDGNISYFDHSWINFATYNDGEWNKVDIQWHSSTDSSENSARYRVNDGTWTDWKHFYNSDSLTYFDNIGYEFDLPGGSGSAFFDTDPH